MESRLERSNGWRASVSRWSRRSNLGSSVLVLVLLSFFDEKGGFPGQPPTCPLLRNGEQPDGEPAAGEPRTEILGEKAVVASKN
jgi:hypothetical protein